jgi:hypothetical protein
MITRRVFQTVQHVFSRDPSLDREAPDFKEAYKRFLSDGEVKGLPLKNGSPPTVFRLASLKKRAMDRGSDVTLAEFRAAMVSPRSVASVAFFRSSAELVQLGLVGADNLADNDGRPLSLKFDDTAAGKVLSAESLNDILYPDMIIELASRILEISTPDPT